MVLTIDDGSWLRLGSDGAWAPLLKAHGMQVQLLQPANCGFDIDQSAHFQERLAEQPVKSVAIGLRSAENGALQFRQGELAVTQTGTEGGLVYALSALIRDTLTAEGSATIWLDPTPSWSV